MAGEIPVLVERLAEPYLPPRLAEKARERAAVREQYAVDFADVDVVDLGEPDDAGEDKASPDLDEREPAAEEVEPA